ncbi:MAG TPA: hypothetical protein VKA38_07440, partial [Draconibacterium sp.]|nr:hypothetical protein [Draconibacterium sp.]
SMKKILTILLVIVSFSVFSQISNTKVVRIANASTVFLQPLSEGNILIDLNTDKSYLILTAVAGTASLSTLTANVDYKEYQSKGTPSVGVLYVSSNQTITHSAADTYYLIDIFTTGSANNMTATSSTLTVPATGYYDIRFHISSTISSNNTIVHASVFVDNIEKAEIEAERKIGTGGDYGNYSGGGILSLSAGNVVTLKSKSSNIGTVTISEANFSIKRIN